MFFFIRGKNSLTEEAFRKDYGRLAEIRSLVHRDVPFIALTATATEVTRKTIIEDLCMKGCVMILGDPNKQNIRYTVREIDQKNLYDTFKPIIDDLEENQVMATKVMVFCRRKEHVKELFELFTQCLGQRAYYRPNGNETVDDRSRLFAMYHKKTHSDVKKTVETQFCKEDGSVRVVFCTIAFGMGVNVKGGNVVIHLGPSSGLDDYLQESGRIGRGNENAHAILLKYKGCTSSRNITKQMKQYISNASECRRVMLLKQFTSNPQPNDVQHSCCDVCAQKCKCLCQCADKEGCSCIETCDQHIHRSLFENHMISTTTANTLLLKEASKKKLKGEKAKQLREDLLEYRAQLGGSKSHEQLLTGLDLATGFTRTLVESIVENAKDISSIEVLLEKFTFCEEKHAEHVWECLCDLTDSSSDESSEADAIKMASEFDVSDSEPEFLRKPTCFLGSSEDSE